MSRLQSVPVDQASGETSVLYAEIKKKLGKVPNLFQALGTSPKVLGNYFTTGAALKAGNLRPDDLETIALATAEKNRCEYCAAAHTVLGKMSGLSEEETIAIRKGNPVDNRRKALVKFVNEIVSERGHISNDSLESFRAAGFTDSQIPDVILAIAQNTFTNYFNNVNHTKVDFPKAPNLT